MSSLRRAEAFCACDGRRRAAIRALCGLAAGLCLPRPATGAADDGRRLCLENTHTREVVMATYWTAGRFRPAELGRLDWLLRDHRTGDVVAMDQRLFDLLHQLAANAGVPPRYAVISGYRSPATNAMLVATTRGVSSRSLHMEGRAIDVRLQGIPTARLRDLAIAKRAGGVGYYPASDFLHLDLGRVRQWSG